MEDSWGHGQKEDTPKKGFAKCGRIGRERMDGKVTWEMLTLRWWEILKGLTLIFRVELYIYFVF